MFRKLSKRSKCREGEFRKERNKKKVNFLMGRGKRRTALDPRRHWNRPFKHHSLGVKNLGKGVREDKMKRPGIYSFWTKKR